MAKKYEDLNAVIVSDKGTLWTQTQLVLNYLDSHPDQVPGRTITESEIRSVYKSKFGINADSLIVDFVRDLGITIVPDPKPTNAEKLADYVRQMDLTPMSPRECGEWLDEQGVKAPGGDDD